MFLPGHPTKLSRGSFRKRSLIEEFESTGVVFVWTKNILNGGAFRKWWRHNNHVISLIEFSSNKSKIKVDCCVFRFLLRSVDGAISGQIFVRRNSFLQCSGTSVVERTTLLVFQTQLLVYSFVFGLFRQVIFSASSYKVELHSFFWMLW